MELYPESYAGMKEGVVEEPGTDQGKKHKCGTCNVSPTSTFEYKTKQESSTPRERRNSPEKTENIQASQPTYRTEKPGTKEKGEAQKTNSQEDKTGSGPMEVDSEGKKESKYETEGIFSASTIDYKTEQRSKTNANIKKNLEMTTKQSEKQKQRECITKMRK